MSFVAPTSPPMDEPRHDSMPFPAKKGNRTRNRKNNVWAKNDHQHSEQQSQLSSPSLNSTPSSISSKPPHLVDSETVSNASLESSKSSRRRRRARGGGRKGKSKNHIASQQQPDAPDGSQKNEQQLLDDAEKELYGSEQEGQHPDEGHPGHHHEQEKEQEQEKEAERPSDTGIQAFNVHRSDPKGGRPVGVKPQRKSRSQHTATQDHCVHCGQSKQPSSEGQEPSQSETQQTRIPRVSVKQNPPRQEPEKEGESAGEDEGKAKEFSIKIDLNLELEIAFKAKVKGEIMLTFLE